MISRIWRRFRHRLSQLIGLPNIYQRLDTLERRHRDRQVEVDYLDQVADYLFLLEIRLKEHQTVTIASNQYLGRAELHNHLAELKEQVFNRIAEVQEAIALHVEVRGSDLSQATDVKLNELRKWIGELQISTLAHLNSRSAEITLATDRKLERFSGEMVDLKRRTVDFQRVIADLRAVATTSFQDDGRQSASADNSFADRVLYQRFEDTFRGNEALIAERQLAYRSEISESLAIGSVLDIGCGRGEWLEILRSAGYDAYGIDSNPVTVNRCLEKGLKVERSEALVHLQSLSDNSLGVVSLFQVLEHIPLNALQVLISEILRVLKPSGAIVAEFPNIQSLFVGGNTFWLDPTHIRPLHPLFVEFIAKEVGFSSTRLHYPKYQEGAETSSDLSSIVLGPPDVALIAIK